MKKLKQFIIPIIIFIIALSSVFVFMLWMNSLEINDANEISTSDMTEEEFYWFDRYINEELNEEELNQIPESVWDYIIPQIIKKIKKTELLGGADEDSMLIETTLCRGNKCSSYYSDDMLGYSVVTRYRTTLSSSMNSTQATVPVASITTFDDHTLTIADLGSKVYLTVEPGRSKEEIVKCTSVTGTTWGGCTRGLAFYGVSESTVTANRKSHNAGSVVVMSNVHYVYEEFVDKDTTSTTTGDLIVTGNIYASSSALYLNDNTAQDFTVYNRNYSTNNPFFKYDESEGYWVFSENGVDTKRWASSTDANLYVAPLGVSSSEVSMNTSTNWFTLGSDGELKVSTSTISSGTASGLGLEDWFNGRWNASTTHPGLFTFGNDLTVNNNFWTVGNATTSGWLTLGNTAFSLMTEGDLYTDGNVTTTATLSVNELCFAGDNCVTEIIKTGKQMLMLPFANSTNTVSWDAADTANAVYTYPVTIPYGMNVSAITHKQTAATAGEKVAFGLYSLDGNTKYLDSGAIDADFDGMVIGKFATTTIQHGSYLLAWTANDAGTGMLGVRPSSPFIDFFNASTTAWGTATNASTNAVLPDTLGAITGSEVTVPLIRLSESL